jgi:hypothetical protein
MWLWTTVMPERLSTKEELDLQREHYRGAYPQLIGRVLFIVLLLGGGVREWGIFDVLAISGD